MEKMTEKEAIEFIKKCKIGRIGIILGPQPYIVPIFYAYHRGRIIFYTKKEGAKLEGIFSNPYICLQVDEIPSRSGYAKSVLVFGKAEIISNPDEKIEALKTIIEKYENYHDIKRDIDEELAKLPEEEFYKKCIRKITIISVIPRKITGRKKKIERKKKRRAKGR